MQISITYKAKREIMRFKREDIPKILKSALKNKFSDFPPKDFEEFIAQLFRDNGYEVERTKYSGDYGVDLIIMKDTKRIAVQVKRYSGKNKVGIKDANQVLGGKDYYRCKNAMIVTTSSFTNSVKNLATRTGLDLWDWNKLQKYICNTYLEGKDYYEYFGEDVYKKEPAQDFFNVRLSKVKYNVLMKGNFYATLVYLKITNVTDKNIDVSIQELPVYISRFNEQIEAIAHYSGYFIGGMVYAGCTVESCFVFYSNKVPQVTEGDKMVLKMTYLDESFSKVVRVKHTVKHTYIQEPPKKTRSECFIATATYGTPMANEIDILRKWRDASLLQNKSGRLFVKIYYRISPPIAVFISKSNKRKIIMRKILKPLIRVLKDRYSK